VTGLLISTLFSTLDTLHLRVLFDAFDDMFNYIITTLIGATKSELVRLVELGALLVGPVDSELLAMGAIAL
jgi:hypothetical protein